MKRLFTLVFGILLALGLKAHPLHLSITNITLENGKVNVIMKTFPDDLEVAYFHYYGVPIDLSDPEIRSGPWLSEYVLGRFRLSGGKENAAIPLTMDTIVFEGESLRIEMSGIPGGKLNSLYIYQALLADIYPDQSNLVILLNEKREYGIKFDVRKLEETVMLN